MGAVDDYLAEVPEEARTALEKLRGTIRAAAPEATETISYRIPTFDYRGKHLVGFSASKNHCTFFTMGYLPPAVEADLAKYDTGRGSVRFPANKPLPAPLVKKVVKARIAEIEAGTSSYGAKGRGRCRSRQLSPGPSCARAGPHRCTRPRRGSRATAPPP